MPYAVRRLTPCRGGRGGGVGNSGGVHGNIGPKDKAPADMRVCSLAVGCLASSEYNGRLLGRSTTSVDAVVPPQKCFS